MRFKTVICLFFTFSYSNIFSYTIDLSKCLETYIFQDNRYIDDEKFKAIKDNYDYSQEEKQINWWTDFKEWLAIQWQKIFGEEFDLNSFWAKFFDVLPYIIIAFAFVLLVWFISRSNPGNQIMRQYKNSKVILSKEEELLMRRNLEKLADEAIDHKNYRLAIRYLYLNSIKRLDLKNIIHYANDKTNYEYVKEIQFSEISKIFKTLTLVYEQIWYGQMIFDDTYFQKFKQECDKLHQTLEHKQYAKA